MNPMDIRAQQEVANEKRRMANIARKDAEARWAWLMSGPQGRKIVSDLMDWTGVYRSSFSTNGSEMSFNEGQRNVGLRILAQVQAASPDGFLKLIEERNAPILEKRDDDND
jgi:hypothetical protein